MEKVEVILRRAFPDREVFTPEEVEFASCVLAASVVGKGERAVLPTRFVAVGETVRVGGIEYRCVARPYVSCPAAACWGCDISRKGRWCQDLQCSVFDRRDHRNVWYVEVQDGE